MSATGRPPKKEEHAPSLFGWVRSATSKTRDEAELNPHLGQVNVGVSQPAHRAFRLPRGVVVWAVVLVAVGILAAVMGPAIATFVEGFEEGLENRDASRSQSFQRKARRLIERESASTEASSPPATDDPAFDELNEMTDCLSGAGGDIDRIVECTSK
jgi:hypothetical protein